MKNPQVWSAGILLLFRRRTVRSARTGFLALVLILIGLSPVGVAASQPVDYAGSAFSVPNDQGRSIAELPPGQSAQITWDTVLLPNPSPDTLLYSLNAVTAIAPNDVWVVGSANDNAGNYLTSALTVHWDGSRWSIISCLGKFPDLRAVSAVSSNDVWAVGGFSTYHWEGANWKEVANSAPSTYAGFYGVAAISGNNIWAVGSSQKPGSGELTHIEHWNGKQWSIVPSPNPSTGGSGPNSMAFNYLSAVAATSAHDVWAVGSYRKKDGMYQSLTLHWDGTLWSVMPTPELQGHNYLTAVTATSPDDVWAVGNLTADVSHGPNGPGPALIMHWDGTRWRVIQSPTAKLRTTLSSVVALPTGDAWIVGTVYDSHGPKSLTIRWNGKQWNVVPSPNPSTNANNLYGVAATQPGDVWAVGYATMPGPQHPLVLHASYIPGLPRTGGSVPSQGELASLLATSLAALAVAVGVLLRLMSSHKRALSS